MSIKSTVLFAGLFIIVSSQSHSIFAEMDKDIEASGSIKSTMRPLRDLDQAKVPLSEFELKSSLPESPFRNDTLITQEALDNEIVLGLKGASVLSTELKDEILTYQLAKQLQFSPTDIKKEKSWLQTIEEKLQKWASHFSTEYYGYGTPD